MQIFSRESDRSLCLPSREAMKPLPLPMNRILLFLTPPSSFLPSFLSLFLALAPPPPSALLPTSRQSRAGGKEEESDRGREGGTGSGGRSVFLSVQFFLSRRRMGRSLLCHPHSPSSPRRVVHAAFYCALSFEAKSSPCDAWDDMSFNTRGMGTLFRVLQMINSSF